MINLNVIAQKAISDREKMAGPYMRYRFEADANLNTVRLIGCPQTRRGSSDKPIVTIEYQEYKGEIELIYRNHL